MTIWQAFRHTLASVMLDKGAIVPAVLGGILYCFFYPLPYLPQTVQHIPVIVADYDASPLSRQFERDLDATREVRVTAVARRVEEAVPALQRGEIGGIVAIPRQFDRDLMRGTPTGVTVMGNGGYIVVDGTILGTTAEVLASTVAAPLAAHLVEANVPPGALKRAAQALPVLIKQPLFNTVQGYESYVVPASAGLIVHQLLSEDAGPSPLKATCRLAHSPACSARCGWWCGAASCSGADSSSGTTTCLVRRT